MQAARTQPDDRRVVGERARLCSRHGRGHPVAGSVATEHHVLPDTLRTRERGGHDGPVEPSGHRMDVGLDGHVALIEDELRVLRLQAPVPCKLVERRILRGEGGRLVVRESVPWEGGGSREVQEREVCVPAQDAP
jgi:hypothetical protein